MNQDILLSKIVPNPTDTAWAQAYTTLNVYITLSIEEEGGKIPVTTFGKELLEKLQREFFALDEKTLENVKKAVGNVSQSLPPEYKYSILVGSIVGDILYIVVASTGKVIIKRNGRVGVIATGTENELHGFSGKLLHDDIVIFETGDFASKLTENVITEQLSSEDVSEIAENITPLIHEGSKGTEAAIILQYKDFAVGKMQTEEDMDIVESKEEDDIQPPHKATEEENLWIKTPENRNIEEIEDIETANEPTEAKAQKPFITLPNIPFGKRKIFILGAVIVLVIALLGSVLLQANKQSEEKQLAEFNTIYQPIKSRYDESVGLKSLNKTLALAEFSETSKLVNDALKKFPQGSEGYKKLSELKAKIESDISELGGGGSAKNVTELLKVGGTLKSITSVSARGGKLAILDSEGEKVATLTNDGKIQKTYDIEQKADIITSDDKFIYAMGDSITQTDLGNGQTKVIVEKAKGNSLQSFGSNVYTVTSDDIIKYRAPSYDESSYFTDSPRFKSTPVAIGISGPVWVLEEGGSIERFTKGVNDNIELKGITGIEARGAKIYADSELDNIYILDVKNQRVVSLDSEGEYQTQYEGSFISNANSFAIDEDNQIGYVVSSNILYSFDL